MSKNCEKEKCKKYDCWEECSTSSDCEPQKCYERVLTVRQVVCNKSECKRKRVRSGYKVKCETDWKPICKPDCKPCEVKCDKKCTKKHQHHY